MDFPGRGNLGTGRKVKVNLYKYDVGEKIFQPGPDGVRFDLTDGGGVLVIQFKSPTAAERRAFKSGLSIRFAVVDQMIFLLVRMGTMQWMDAPYYRKLSQNLTRVELPDEGEGLAIHAMLVDGATGVLQAQKLIGLDTDTSRKLVTAVMVQPKIPDYDMRLSHVFEQYNTTDLLEEAETLC